MTEKHEKSSCKFFDNSGFSNYRQELVSATLTAQIYRILRDQVTRAEAVKLLGATHAQISALMHCCPLPVSVGRLIEFLTALGQDVRITVQPVARCEKGRQGRLSFALQA